MLHLPIYLSVDNCVADICDKIRPKRKLYTYTAANDNSLASNHKWLLLLAIFLSDVCLTIPLFEVQNGKFANF